MVSPSSEHGVLGQVAKHRRYKVVLLGESGVGKTCLITRFMYDRFEEDFQPTVGIDFLCRTVRLRDGPARLQIWDTAGQERFRCLVPAYARDSSAALVVYDVTNRESFLRAAGWAATARDGASSGQLVLVLAANKVDLGRREVASEEGQLAAERMGAVFVETSAKTGLNVDLLFRRLVERLSGDLVRRQEPREEEVVDVVLEEGQIGDQQQRCAC